MGPENQARVWDFINGQTDDLEHLIGGKIRLGLHKVKNPKGPGLVDGIIVTGLRLPERVNGGFRSQPSVPPLQPVARSVSELNPPLPRRRLGG
jgi:hypothetical protein